MMPFRPPRPPLTPTTATLTLLTLSLPTYLLTTRIMSTNTKPPSSSSPNNPNTFPTRPYTPSSPASPFPYTPQDFLPADPSPDTTFYSTPRFCTHIDDHAIALLRTYYASALPRRGRVLDLCSSWISHFPASLEELAISTKKKKKKKKSIENHSGENGDSEEDLEVIGLGMNQAELSSNPILSTTHLQNLNDNPTLPPTLSPLTTTVCALSIDYLTQPLPVLSSLYSLTKEGGTVHLVISNRCFPTKAVGRWLRIGEEERLRMVGDYLWWSGWRGVEVVEVCDGRGEVGGWRGMLGVGGVDPLWVVRGVKMGEREGEGEKSGV